MLKNVCFFYGRSADIQGLSAQVKLPAPAARAKWHLTMPRSIRITSFSPFSVTARLLLSVFYHKSAVFAKKNEEKKEREFRSQEACIPVVCLI